MALRRKLAGMQPRGGIPGTGAGERARGGLGGAVTAAARVPDSASHFGHAALFYRTPGEYARFAGGFVRAGLDAGDPVMVAVPAPSAEVIRKYLGLQADRVTFAEMTMVGRNPARIIAAMHAFADSHPGQVVLYVGESVWQSRTAAERAEVMRHEALVNVAFSAGLVRMLCPYDAAALEPELIAEAEREHPALMRGGHLERNPAFAGPAAHPVPGRHLPGPPAGLEVLTYRDDPGSARQFVRERARAAGLTEPGLTDLVIAVGELAANTLRHTRGPGTVRVWADSAEVLCEVRDGGHIRDPLAGRRCPAPDAGGGHGLWVVHQVCDLVEMRTGGSGTVFRLHMGLPNAAA